MKARKINLVKFGEPHDAFKLEDFELEDPKADEIQVEVSGSGLNFADVMARRGQYAPVNKLPFVLGYDVVGKVVAIGQEVDKALLGKTVLSLTRFEGYQSHVNLSAAAAVVIPDDISSAEAISYSTAFLTAYLMAEEYTGLTLGKNALVYSAAGGVGYFLYHFLKLKGLNVKAVVGHESKKQLLENRDGFEQVALNSDFESSQEQFDLIFNARGGQSVKTDIKRLKPGGKLVLFGAADQLNHSGLLGKLKLLWGFGFYSPIRLIMKSQSLCGFNLLALSKEHPALVMKSHQEAFDALLKAGIRALPSSGFSPEKVSEAHALLESGQSTGKIFVRWN